MVMDNRFESAKLYLIDLLRAYGHRPVVVKVRMDGEPVEVMAKNMVKKQLTAAGILFFLTVRVISPINIPSIRLLILTC